MPSRMPARTGRLDGLATASFGRDISFGTPLGRRRGETGDLGARGGLLSAVGCPCLVGVSGLYGDHIGDAARSGLHGQGWVVWKGGHMRRLWATLDTPFSWLPSLLPSFLPCHRDGRAACRRAPSRTNLHSLPTTPTSRGRVCRFEALWAGSSHTAMAPRRTKAAAVAARGPSSHSREHLRASLASSLFTKDDENWGPFLSLLSPLLATVEPRAPGETWTLKGGMASSFAH